MRPDHPLMNDVLEIPIPSQDDTERHSSFHPIESEFKGHLFVKRFRIDVDWRG